MSQKRLSVLPWRAIVAIVTLAAVVRMAQSVACPVSSCSSTDPNLPVIWLNTTSMGCSIQGLRWTTYPMTPDFPNVFAGAYASFDLIAIQEILPNTAGVCDLTIFDPSLSSTTGQVLRSLDPSQLCCEAVASWDMLEPTINRTTVAILVSDPRVPDFRFNISLSVANESISYRVNGSAGTDYKDWFEVYSDRAAKITMELENWPWVGQNRSDSYSNPSYLKLFIKATCTGLSVANGLMRCVT